MQTEIIAEETVVELPDFLATRLAYDERDALFFALLPLMIRRGRMSLYPKFERKMQAARGKDKVERFNRYMARLIRAYGG